MKNLRGLWRAKLQKPDKTHFAPAHMQLQIVEMDILEMHETRGGKCRLSHVVKIFDQDKGLLTRSKPYPLSTLGHGEIPSIPNYHPSTSNRVVCSFVATAGTFPPHLALQGKAVW